MTTRAVNVESGWKFLETGAAGGSGAGWAGERFRKEGKDGGFADAEPHPHSHPEGPGEGHEGGLKAGGLNRGERTRNELAEG